MVPMRWVRRIAVAPFGLDTLAPAPFDSVVNPEHNQPVRNEDSNQKAEQQAKRGTRVLGGTVKHPMVGHELPFLSEPQDMQQARYCMFHVRQDRAQQRNFRMLLADGKQRRRAQDRSGNTGWQTKHGSISWQEHQLNWSRALLHRAASNDQSRALGGWEALPRHSKCGLLTPLPRLGALNGLV